MRGGVGVATDDGHTRQGESLLRTYHVDDAIILRHHAIMRQSEVGGILCQRIHLFFRYRVLDGFVLIMRRRVVIRHAIDL